MNNMPHASDLFKFIFYADDTTLFGELDYSLSLVISASSELINREFSSVGEWPIINQTKGRQTHDAWTHPELEKKKNKSIGLIFLGY